MSYQRLPRSSGPGPFDRPPRREPMFNVPAVVTAMLLFMWALQVARDTVLSPTQDRLLLLLGGFRPIRYSPEFIDQSWAWLWSPVTYSLLHGGFGHLIVNSIWLLAFGAVVARRIGPVLFLVFWVISAIVSAAAYWLLHQHSPIPMIGASGVVSALMGAAARFAFPKEGGFNRLYAHLQPRNSIPEALSNRTVLVYVGVWFAINALTAFGFGAEAGARIAWEAHMGGFLFGFLAFALFDRRPTIR